jgi:hypothetical protein
MPPIHHDVEALKQNIHEEIYSIQQHDLQTPFRNLFKRIQKCLKAEGRHLEHYYDGEYNNNYYT